jgi:hypothetical protein
VLRPPPEAGHTLSGSAVKIYFSKKPRHFQEDFPDRQSAIGKYCRYAKVGIGFKRQFFMRRASTQ